MRVIKYAHSCLRVERDGVLVIDPGVFTAVATALDGADAVLITHEHADHVDVDALADALAARPSVRIYTHAEVIPKLGPLAELATPVAAGTDFTAAGLRIRAYGGWHAVIHPDIPRVVNLGFLVEESLYHPGDSFDVPADVTVETVFVPISAPWMKLSEAVDFVRAMAPRRAYALHDCLLSDAGHQITDGAMARLSGCGYARLPAGTAVDL